jgi:adenine deaminase
MNRALRHAIACGCYPLIAIQMATINTATHFGLKRELGSIAPGRRADVILTSDLRALPVDMVFARGVKVPEGGQLTVTCPHYDWPEDARTTMRMGREKTARDFAIAAPAGASRVTTRVIGVVENQAPTRALTAEMAVTVGLVEAQADVAQIALVERHRATGQIVNAFVSGFG